MRRKIYVGLVWTGFVSLAALLLGGILLRYLAGPGLASPGGDYGSDLTTNIISVDPNLGPILDLSTPGVQRSPLRPKNTSALTFDDGPDATWTPKVLDVLQRHNAKATFFTTGANVLENPDLVQRIRVEGHDVGSHTFSHPALGSLPPWQERFQLSLTNVVLSRNGFNTRILRPPFSGRPKDMTKDELAAARRSGYLVVLTDAVARDWDDISPEQMVANIEPETRNGGVITFHDGGGDRSRTVAALDLYLTKMEGKNFQFVTISDFAGLKPGQAYQAPTFVNKMAAWIIVGTVQVADVTRVAVRYGSLTLLVLGVLRAIFVLVMAQRSLRKERHRAANPTHNEYDLPAVSVMVPAYNEEAGIEPALRSLVASDYPRFEIVVIDDGSTDRTAEISRSLELPNVRVLTQLNGGKAAALNNGIRNAAHDIVVLIDGDTVFEKGTLRALAIPLLDPTIGAVGGTVKVGNRKGFLGRWQHIEYVVSCGIERRMFDEIGCVPCVPGAVGAYRRAAVLEAGGVPTSTLAEDTDLTMMVQRNGWKVAFAPEARAWTEVPLTLKSIWRQRYRWTYGTMQAMWKNRHSIVEGGPGGRLGRFAFPYIAIFSLLFAFLGPFVDLYAIVSLFEGHFVSLVLMWGAMNFLAFLLAARAFGLEGEKLRTLWAMPFQQVIFRQLMYLVVLASMRSAIFGDRLRWHKLKRTGLDLTAIARMEATV